MLSEEIGLVDQPEPRTVRLAASSFERDAADEGDNRVWFIEVHR